MKYLIKLDRFFAWVLFGGMLLYFISGYGMTKGIIDPSLATKLHLNFLTYIILISFMVHPLFAIHLALKRWQLWTPWPKFLLFTFFTLFFGLFVYVDRYYQPYKQSGGTTTSTVSQSTNAGQDDFGEENNVATVATNQNIDTSNSSTTTAQKTFTVAELAQYNGQNGNPSYVAVDGNIYDLSAVFRNGSHYSHVAGKELTNSFYIRHAKSALAKYPVMGKLVN